MCLRAEHTGCRSATIRAFVFIIIITYGNKCGMDSGVASVVYSNGSYYRSAYYGIGQCKKAK